MAKLDFIAKAVREYEENGEKKTRWTDIGVGFVNKDSITVMLNALPIGDKIVLMKPPKVDEKGKMQVFGEHAL